MMKNKSKPFAIIFMGLLWGSLVHAQVSANASGGDATGSGGTVAYSIGQVVYTAITGSNGTASQGVQQAFEIFTVGIIETDLNISLSAFPNPTSETLTLQISDYNPANYSYQLFDMQGKQLNNGLIESHQTRINMQNLPSAAYFIHVVNPENKKVQSFKIIKN